MPTVELCGGLLPAAGQAIRHVQAIEHDLLGHLPREWVRANGPRINNLRAGMILLHTAVQTVNAVVVSKKTCLPQVEAAFIELAATCLKVVDDINYIAHERPQLNKFDQPPPSIDANYGTVASECRRLSGADVAEDRRRAYTDDVISTDEE